MMNSNINHKRTKKLTVEKYFTGELGPSESAELELHLKDCVECKEHLSSLEENKRQFHGAHPFGSFLDAVKERSTPWYMKLFESLFQPALRPVYALMLIICVALPVYFNYINNQAGIRTKGVETISFAYRRDGIINKGNTDDTFRANDEIQILYTSTSSRYLSLFSIDTKGSISFYHPEINSKWCSIEVDNINKQEHYPSSIVLDDTPGNELVVAVFTAKPVYVETVEQKIGKILDKNSANLNDVKKKIESRNPFKKGNVKTLMLNKK